MKIIKTLNALYIDKNTLYSISSKIIAMICFLLTDILLARLLTMQQYGEWVYFFSIINIIFHIGYFGFNSTTKIHVARSINDTDNMSQYLKAAIMLRFFISVVVCLVLFLIQPWLSAILGYPSDYSNLRYLMLFGILMLLFNTINEFFKAIWVGVRKLNNLFYQVVTEHSLILLIGISLVYITNSNISMTFGYIGAYLISILLMIILLKSYINKKRLSLKTVTSILPQAKNLLQSAPPLLLFSINSIVMLELDIILLGIITTHDQVAVYGVAKRICSRIGHINLAYIMALMPTFALIDEKNRSQKKKEFWNIMKVNMLIATGIAIILLAGVHVLIPLLYGADFTQSVSLVYTLLPYYIITAAIIQMSALLDYQKKFLWRNIYFIAANILGVLLNIILIPTIGTMGAVLSITIISLAYAIVLIILVSKFFRSQYASPNAKIT